MTNSNPVNSNMTPNDNNGDVEELCEVLNDPKGCLGLIPRTQTPVVAVWLLKNGYSRRPAHLEKVELDEKEIIKSFERFLEPHTCGWKIKQIYIDNGHYFESWIKEICAKFAPSKPLAICWPEKKICKGCGKSETMKSIIDGGFISCCPDGNRAEHFYNDAIDACKAAYKGGKIVNEPCKCLYESDCHGIEMIKSPSGKEWAIGGTDTQDRWKFCPWCGGALINKDAKVDRVVVSVEDIAEEIYKLRCKINGGKGFVPWKIISQDKKHPMYFVCLEDAQPIHKLLNGDK